ncbi:MAG: hypothetical protein LPK00_00155 [Bacillaceae bacterium]|nr:hypothetical protein [Bacillaceae bacterium]
MVKNRVEIIASALLVLVVYFYFDNQSKMKKLEKRIEELESKFTKNEKEF